MASTNPLNSRNDSSLGTLIHTTQVGRSSWHGTAFIVEALILLAILAGCIAVFMQLFANAHSVGEENADLARAIVIASNTAEEFATSPSASSNASSSINGFHVNVNITPESTGAGTMYRAEITVSKDNKDVYSLTTARYVSGEGVQAAQSPAAQEQAQAEAEAAAQAQEQAEAEAAAQAEAEATENADAPAEGSEAAELAEVTPEAGAQAADMPAPAEEVIEGAVSTTAQAPVAPEGGVS